MKQSIYSFLNEPKTKIGWVHGLISCIGSFISSFLIMSLISSIIFADFAYKTIPPMIITPLLFSKTYFEIIKKILYLIIIYLIIVFLKGVI
jgi:hypothetical protein